jgi:hypothetical protein
LHETDRLVVRFGPAIQPQELQSAPNAAELIMDRIRTEAAPTPSKG